MIKNIAMLCAGIGILLIGITSLVEPWYIFQDYNEYGGIYNDCEIDSEGAFKVPLR
jgi:hypothetical protein